MGGHLGLWEVPMGFMKVTSSTWEVALCPKKVSWSFKQDARRIKALALYLRVVTLCLIMVTKSFLNLRPLVVTLDLFGSLTGLLGPKQGHFKTFRGYYKQIKSLNN